MRGRILNLKIRLSLRDSRGFIALISVMIISLVLLFSVVALGERGLASRFLLLDLERKSVSENLAEACVQSAIILIANDAAAAISAPGVPVPVGADGCQIYSILSNTPVVGRSTIIATSTYPNAEGATTNLKVVVNNSAMSDVNIISREELPHVP